MPLTPIAVVTGSRADFGLLLPVMQAIQAHPKLQLQTIAAGTHLISNSLADLKAAGFPHDAKVSLQRRNKTGRTADALALAAGVSGFTHAFATLQPQLVLALGDRIEPFAAAAAATALGLRFAHLHGGDRAEGVADEALRHATAKLAHLHFPATTQSRRRLIRMGEHPDLIFNHGSPAIDALQNVTPAPDAPTLLLLHHPTGLDEKTEYQLTTNLLKATQKPTDFIRGPTPHRLILLPNHDPGRPAVLRAIADHTHPTEVRDHLPRPEFLALLAGAKALVGNSSAGLIEAAALKTPAVNLGHRQRGRQRPASVIDCPHPTQTHIRQAIQQALNHHFRGRGHPYGNGTTGQQIAHTLATLSPADIPLAKHNTY
ncbi:MAG: UDP-N-acetylglucosamine 2-epimerase [Planctomycetota bacterium]